MILGAALLVLVALGLFVGGIATGATALYWACVGVSAGAAVLLVLARRQLSRPEARPAERLPAERLPAPPPPPVRRVPPGDDVQTRVQPIAGPDDEVPVGSHGSPASGADPVTEGTATTASVGRSVEGEDEEPPVEEVEVTDLLLVVDLHDDVVVVDEHPRYHLADCPWLSGRTPIPLPLDEARTDGFTPCGVCAPDRHLAALERARRSPEQGR